MNCYDVELCKDIDCVTCSKLKPSRAIISKELMVCTCGNSKNEIYAELIGMKISKISIKCPRCKKESLIAHMDGNLRNM